MNNKFQMVASHGKDVARLGLETLRTASAVVRETRREIVGVLARRRTELRDTLEGGVLLVAQKLQRINRPTRKEQAEAHKIEVKARTRARRSQKAKSNGAAAGHPAVTH